MGPISSQQTGITNLELKEAIPESLFSKSVHLHWVEKFPSGNGLYTLTAKIEVDGQILLLSSKNISASLIEDWNVNDIKYHTNARLLALERILTDPMNEDIIISL